MSTSIIMLGVPGAGKTRWVLENAATYAHRSADKLRVMKGVYTFDPTNEVSVHRTNLRLFTMDVVNGVDAICDNTNTTLVQIAPYVALGMAFSDECRVVYVRGPIPACVERNTHGVPEEVIWKMHWQIQDMLQQWPSHWPKVEKVVEL